MNAPSAENGLPRTGIERIAAERQRQMAEEGYSAKHDAEHDNSALAWAAACYAAPERIYLVGHGEGSMWWREPWPHNWRRIGAWSGVKKVGGTAARVRELEKAGALIAAEIDRLTRVTSPEGGRA